MKSNTLAVALAALLVGGVAIGAYHNSRDTDPTAAAGAAGEEDARGLDYAEVIGVTPVTEKAELFATVIGSEAVRETTTSSSPRQVCNDVVVQERLPERDGNVGGTVAGAVIGGLVGNQVGGGNGRKLATAAGATAGGVIGNRVDRNHVGGRVVERVDRQCRTVQDTSQSSQVVAWNVTYRNPDGTTGTMRTGDKPGDRISLGTEDQTIAYDVTYRYDGSQQTVRLQDDPGDRLPVIDGEVMARVAGSAVPDRG
ncbi:glycine zipper 2TM domain-containing protein [Luteimonas sp. A611]